MNVLIIVGECVQVNTSASLCNLAYLRGLVETGNRVTLLSADPVEYETDPTICIPPEVRCFTYRGMSLYEKLSVKKKQRNSPKLLPSGVGPKKNNSKHKLIKRIKKTALSLYGVHGIYQTFVSRAQHFRLDEEFDCVISLSTPPSSHLLASKLLASRHIKSKHWMQVWEDPWYGDIDIREHENKVFREERRLLSLGERICYVSPITLAYQKRFYPEAAEKMIWVPLPSYYEHVSCGHSDLFDPLCFGYFGEYRLTSRDLRPFYNAAVSCGIEVEICGNSDFHLESTELIHIHPRLGLDALKPLEEKTGVLVFLCNRGGGQIPGKIYQYAATDKTVLFILDGTDEEKQILKSYFEPFHRFVFCENTQEDIERAIRRIQRGDLGGVKNEPVSAFSPARITERILEESVQGRA